MPPKISSTKKIIPIIYKSNSDSDSVSSCDTEISDTDSDTDSKVLVKPKLKKIPICSPPLVPSKVVTKSFSEISTPIPNSKSMIDSVKTLEQPIVSNTDRLVLAQSTNKFAMCGDNFTEAVQLFNTLNATKINELKMALESKAQEYDDIICAFQQEIKTKQHENEIKYNIKKYEYDESIKQFDRIRVTKQIDTHEQLKTFHIEACQKIANKNNSILIINKDYQKLRQNISCLEAEFSKLITKKNNIIKNRISCEKKIIQDNHKYEMTKVNLVHREEIAELMAFIKHQKREVEILKSTSTTMKQEIIEQRLLTKEIAVASSGSNIQQKFA